MWTRVLGTIAGIEAVAVLLYAVIDVVAVARDGLTGPEAVSNPAALVVQILIFVAFGAGMFVLARGWWNRQRWVRGPFILGQLLGLVVGIPLIQSSGWVRGVGAGLVLLCGGALAVSLLPSVTRALHGDQAAT